MQQFFRTHKRTAAFCAILFWIVLWQLAAMAVGQELFLASPLSVLSRLLQLPADPTFRVALAGSFLRISGGFFAGFLAGIGLAALAGRYHAVRVLLEPLMTALKACPVASFVILALILVGSRSLAVLISFVMVFPIIYTNALQGLDSADPELLEMAAVFGIPPLRRAAYIVFPALSPYLRAGMAVSLGLCWKSGVAAEVIGLTARSLGRMLYDSKIYLDTASLFAYTAVIILASRLFEQFLLALFARLDRRLAGRRPE